MVERSLPSGVARPDGLVSPALQSVAARVEAAWPERVVLSRGHSGGGTHGPGSLETDRAAVIQWERLSPQI